MLTVSHTDQSWISAFRRMNGALTYSQDLVKYQIPNWEKVLGEDPLISTCPSLHVTDVTGRFKTVIQYLHSYPYTDPVGRVRRILNDKKFKCDKLIFITAYKELGKELFKDGLNAVYIAMSIYTGAVQ